MEIGQHVQPVGARVAARALSDAGVNMSEASISRMLVRLDALGLTRGVARKGRVLTVDGQSAVEQRRQQLRQNESFDRALDLRSIDEVLDWLRARRVLEGEAAYLAALRAEESELAEFESAMREHEELIKRGSLGLRTIGMQFHVLIAKAAQSPIFEALVDSLTSSKVHAVEDALDFITASRGTMGDSAAEHRKLFAAIKARDAAIARQVMQEHIGRLEEEVLHFAEHSSTESLSAAIAMFKRAASRSATTSS
jgi:DNA-binding FadR family transcriptional regulator